MTKYDYLSPGLERPPDATASFPDRIEGDPTKVNWRWMRRNDPHKWYCDRTMPTAGFINADETAIVYNTARMFAGKRALEVGCLFGWSTWHIAQAGCQLDVVDPLLSTSSPILPKVRESLKDVRVSIVGVSSPGALAAFFGKWSFIFIDADHDLPHPVLDAVAAEHRASENALILFHDVICPDVYDAVRYLEWRGWQKRIYFTSQMMAACWRGDVAPVDHTPDPAILALSGAPPCR